MKKQKTLRTLLATLLLVVMMVMALPVHAATPTGSITLNGVEENATVTVYKLAAFNYNETAGQPEYPTYNWVDAVNTWVGAQDAYKTYVNGTGLEAFAASGKEAEVYGAMTAAIKSGTLVVDALDGKASQEGNTVTISNLEVGTYLVVVEGVKNVYQPIVRNVGMKAEGGNWVVDNDTLNLTEDVKFTTVAIEKTVTGDNHNTSEAISYDIKADVPTYPASAIAKKFVVSDKLPETMELVAGTIKFYGIKGEAEPVELPTSAYTLTTENAKRHDDTEVTFLVDFDYESIKEYDKVEVAYDAKLKPEAATTIYGEGHKNNAYLDYSNNPYDASSWETDEPETPPTVKTYGFNLKKVDNKDAVLTGAEFAVKTSANGAKLKFTKVSDGVYYYDVNGTETDLAVNTTTGILEVRGLKEGKYFYEETKAPAGYNKLPDVVEVTVGKTAVDTHNVVNKSGFALPVTGGMGTVIFTVSGVALIVVGAIILVTINKRKNASK